MAKYRIRDPKGDVYTIEAPDNASEEDVLTYLQQNINTTNEVVEEKKELPVEVEETTFGDIAQSIGSGLIRGLAVEPAKTGLNLMGDSKGADSIEKAFNNFQDYTGLRPDSGGGEIAERLSGFLGAFIGLGKVSRVLGIAQKPLAIGQKAGLTRRVTQAARTSVRGGAAEFLSSPDNAVTLADSFDALPEALKTDNEVMVNSRDEAKRRISNKLKLGAEATAFGLAVEAAFPIVGVAVKGTSKLNIPGVTFKGYQFGVGGLLKSVSDGFGFLGSTINKGMGRLPEKYFSSKGVTPDEIYEQIADIKGITKLDADKVSSNIALFDKELKKVVKGQNLFGRGRLGINQAHNNLYDFLSNSNPNALDSYGGAVKTAATNMRKHIDDISTQYIDDIQARITSGELDATYGQQIINTINEQQGEYVRRVYEGAFSKGDTLDAIRLKPEYAESVRKLAAKFPNEDDAVQKATRIIEENINANAVDGGVTAQQTIKNTAMALRMGEKQVGDKPLYDVMEGLFKTRDKFLYDIPEFRTLLNEAKDPISVYTKTISDMSTTLNASRLYSSLSDQLKMSAQDGIASLSSGGRPLIISGENLTEQNSINFLKQNGYVKLGDYVPQKPIGSVLDQPVTSDLTDEMIEKMSVFGGKYGKISGDYVAPEVYNSITMGVRGDGIFNNLLGISLQMKGLAQMTKTVYNPLSQVRNFNSGIFFVGANGNIMRNMNLSESMALSFKNISNLSTPEQKEFFEMTARLGIRDENLAVNEFRDLIKKGEQTKYDYLGMLDKVPGAKPLQNLYTGTDTYWKTVGFLGEKAKYSAAFKKAGIQNVDDITEDLIKAGISKRQKGELLKDIDGLDVLAGDIVKDTMPIYSRVPEAVKFLRKVPFFGAFASFPSEIIRNTTNILSRGVDEMAFVASPELIAKIGSSAAKKLESQIRAIGAQRLTGYVSSAYIVPKATVMAAQKMTGVSDEELETIRSNFLAEYMVGQNIMPLSKIKKDSRGDFNFEYANLSYMMPYDFMLQPARAALDTYNKKGSIDAATAGDITASVFKAFEEFSAPFAGESLAAERIFDVTFRNGRTDSGIRVYNENDSQGAKLKKGLMHVLNAFNPAILEQTIFKPTARGPGGNVSVEMGRIGKAFSSVTGEISPSKGGVVYDPASEMLSAFTGIRSMKANLTDSLYYKTQEFNKGKSSIKTTLNNYIDDSDVTQTDIIQGYTDANNRLFQLQKNLYATIQNARNLGMDEATIYKKIKIQGNVSEGDYELISKGVFSPYRISEDAIEEFYENRLILNEPNVAKTFPRVELGKIYDNLILKSLIESNVDEAIKSEVPSLPTSKDITIKKDSGLSKITPIPKPVSSNTVSSPSTTDVSLLGSNPIEAMKNAQIAQRRTV